jgi:hypothetical protein
MRGARLDDRPRRSSSPRARLRYRSPRSAARHLAQGGSRCDCGGA